MSQAPIQVNALFASPLVRTRLQQYEPLNTRLRELFLKWEADPTRKRSSAPTPVVKVAVYESDFSLFDNPEPEIQALKQFCLQCTG
ncbi:MAG: hypothetical protein KGQ62_07900, partial [Gammaproteobacteria bacterium]|nr:hypothetical protein [Gammaproteobacteria bacterium]MDE2108766.1 hypothetical protein [Gammaproteobacteria bacterium]